MTAIAPEQQEHRYAPAGSALDLFRNHGTEVLLSRAAGTGKSRACLEKLHAMCLRYPGMRGLMVRKTAVSLSSTGLVTYREIVAREAIADIRRQLGQLRSALGVQDPDAAEAEVMDLKSTVEDLVAWGQTVSPPFAPRTG